MSSKCLKFFFFNEVNDFKEKTAQRLMYCLISDDIAVAWDTEEEIVLGTSAGFKCMATILFCHFVMLGLLSNV